MFRLRNLHTRLWYKSLDGMEITWTWNKPEALVFPQDKREFWEADQDCEIVPLDEGELMSRTGQPRFEGF